MTTKFAVVGSPISHSLSPLLHESAYLSLGLDFDYQAFEIRAGLLKDFLATSDIAGLSITMPLKEEAFQIGSVRDTESELTGVSNTLIRTASGWAAFNTDVFGIKQAVAGVEVETVTIIGSGATARSAILAVSHISPAARVRILGRNSSTVSQLVLFARNLGLESPVSKGVEEVLTDSLVISTTPAGSLIDFWSEVRSSASPKGTLLDVAYNPWPSVAAKSWSPGMVISGIEMLKWQAAMQVKLFADHFAPEVSVDLEQLYWNMSEALK